MKIVKQVYTLLAAAIILGGLTACGALEMSISSDDMGGSSSFANSPALQAESGLAADFESEPPVPEIYRKIPLPDFLDEGQQFLYLRAKTIFPVFSIDTSLIDSFTGKNDTKHDPESTEIDGKVYYISNGRYQKWADFESVMLSIFTKDYYQVLIREDDDHPAFLKIDGHLYYEDRARGSRYGYAPEEMPDTYELVKKTDYEITFNVTGYYYLRGEEDRDAMDSETFPIKMVLTEKGWRISEFNIAQ